MHIDIISLFPSYFKGPFDESILKRAKEANLLSINIVDLRERGLGRHHKVDDTVFGGSPGMLLRPEPLKKAIDSVKRDKSHVIYLSPQGKLFNFAKAKELSQKEHLILLSGHYEGIDQRIIESEVDEEISIGDYVLTNGALAAIVIVDALARFIPGVLGNELSSESDSFQNGLLDAPSYTQPKEFEGRSVPDILFCGDHERIKKWRHEQAILQTMKKREDLYFSYLASRKEEICEGEAEKSLSFTLIVDDLQKSIRFFRKVLKCSLVFQDEESAYFREGIWLAIGAKKPYPFLLTLNVNDKKTFDSIALTLIREGLAESEVKGRNEKRELAFTDGEGTLWLLRES